MLGALVMKGVRDTSRTLKTLIPKISWVPRENSRISMPVRTCQLGAGIDSLEQPTIGLIHVHDAPLRSDGLGQVCALGDQAAQHLGKTLGFELGDVFIDTDGATELLVGHAGQG